MGKSRDFAKFPPQEYENRDFLYQGIWKAKDLKSVADYALAGARHLKDPVYREQIGEESIKKVRGLLGISDEIEAEKILQEEMERLSQEKYGTGL